MCIIKVKNKKYDTVVTVLTSTINIVERDQIYTPNTKYMTANFPGIIQALK